MRGWLFSSQDSSGALMRARFAAPSCHRAAATLSRTCLASAPVDIVERALRTSRARSEAGSREKKPSDPSGSRGLSTLTFPPRRARIFRASCSAGVRRRGHRALELASAAQRKRVLRLRRARARGAKRASVRTYCSSRSLDCLDADAANEYDQRRELELSILFRGTRARRAHAVRVRRLAGARARARPAEPRREIFSQPARSPREQTLTLFAHINHILFDPPFPRFGSFSRRSLCTRDVFASGRKSRCAPRATAS